MNVLERRRKIAKKLIEDFPQTLTESEFYDALMKYDWTEDNDGNYVIKNKQFHFYITVDKNALAFQLKSVQYCFPQTNQEIYFRPLKFMKKRIIKFYQDEMKNGNKNGLVKSIKSKFVNEPHENSILEFFVVFEIKTPRGRTVYLKEMNHKNSDTRWVDYIFVKPKLISNKTYITEKLDF